MRGEVRLHSFTHDPSAIGEYGQLEMGDGTRRLEIDSLRSAKDCFIACFKGVTDRAQAQALRNLELFVPRERLPTIEEEDTFYVADLIGLRAETPDGDTLGIVTAVHNFGAGDIIEIAPTTDGLTLLLPFAEAVVPEVDVNGGKIVVVVPEVEAIPPLKGEGRPPE